MGGKTSKADCANWRLRLQPLPVRVLAAGGIQQARRTRVRRNHPDIAPLDSTRRFLGRSVFSTQPGSISTSQQQRVKVCAPSSADAPTVWMSNTTANSNRNQRKPDLGRFGSSFAVKFLLVAIPLKRWLVGLEAERWCPAVGGKRTTEGKGERERTKRRTRVSGPFLSCSKSISSSRRRISKAMFSAISRPKSLPPSSTPHTPSDIPSTFFCLPPFFFLRSGFEFLNSSPFLLPPPPPSFPPPPFLRGCEKPRGMLIVSAQTPHSLADYTPMPPKVVNNEGSHRNSRVKQSIKWCSVIKNNKNNTDNNHDDNNNKTHIGCARPLLGSDELNKCNIQPY